MLRIALGLLAALVALLLIVVLIGWSLPLAHRATRSATVAAAPPQVFDLVADVGAYPQWRQGVTRVEVLGTDAAGLPSRFREHVSDGAIEYAVAERVAPRRLVHRIADPSLPFGGRWTFEVAPAGAGSTLTITEDGEVYNPIFRFVSRFVMGHSGGIDRFLVDVERRIGRTAG